MTQKGKCLICEKELVRARQLIVGKNKFDIVKKHYGAFSKGLKENMTKAFDEKNYTKVLIYKNKEDKFKGNVLKNDGSSSLKSSQKGSKSEAQTEVPFDWK